MLIAVGGRAREGMEGEEHAAKAQNVATGFGVARITNMLSEEHAGLNL